jgi:hypothetical protein
LFGLFFVSAHFGMCRSATVSLNLRPQCGHSTRSSWAVDLGISGSGAPVRSASPYSRAALMAFRNSEDFAFHFSFLTSFFSGAFSVSVFASCFAEVLQLRSVLVFHSC